MPEEPSSAEVLQRLALSLKSIKDELQLWHAESQQNQSAIDSLGKRLDALSQKTEVPPKVRQELDEIKSLVQAVAAKPGQDFRSPQCPQSRNGGGPPHPSPCPEPSPIALQETQFPIEPHQGLSLVTPEVKRQA